MSLCDLFNQPTDRLALESANGVGVSLGELGTMINAVQKQLLPKIHPEKSSKLQAVVSISLVNSIEFVVAFLAICNAGLAAAPLNPKYRSDEIKFYAEDAQSQAIILPWDSSLAKHGSSEHPAVTVARQLQMSVWEIKFDSHLKAIKFRCTLDCRSKQRISSPHLDPEFHPDNVALILHTSGTTSKPKCVPLSHRNITRTLDNIKNTYKLTEDDKSLVVMPLFHVHGLIGALLSTLWSGGVAVVMAFSVTSHWDTFCARQCTWYSAVPTIHQLLLAKETSYSSGKPRGRLRFIRSCSAALAPATLKQLESAYGVPVLEAYAMTEASHQMTSNPLPPAKRKPGSVGIPQGVEVCILDDNGGQVRMGGVGEVCIKGPNVTGGYLNRPEANISSFTQDGWFRTGDQGYFDSDGYLFLTGRLKEMINRAGEKISPLEIDAILLEYPGVVEAVSFAVPDKVYGEEVNAAVVIREGYKVTANDLTRHCQSKLATFKLPKRIFFARELPRTATGKIQRRFVAAHFLKKLTNAKL